MPTSTLDAESLATSPADIISFGEKDGADPRSIAEALQSHRDNIASWASENITDPNDWWEGVQKLDTDTAEGLQKMRASHLRSTVAKELPDARDQQNFLYELQASGFDPDSMPAEFKPVVDAYKNALADEVFKGARRRLNGKIRNGDQTLAYFDMVDNGEKDESIDVVLKFPNVQTGGDAFRSFTVPEDFANIDETIKSNATIGEVKSAPSFATEKISIPNATDKEAQDEAVRLDQEAARLRKQADSFANQKPSVLGQEADAGYGASVMADQFKAQAFDLEQQARYLKENGRVGLITNRVREALKESSNADKIGQGLFAGLPEEFAKGLATASIDLGVLNQRIQGDEEELKQLVQGKSELDTALEGASRTRFAGNVVGRGIASGVESLGTMAPFLAGGIATRGLSSAATRAAMDAGSLGIPGAGMAAESAGSAYGEAEQLAQEAEKAGDTDRAARIRDGRDLYAVMQAIVDTATERINPLHSFKRTGRGVRNLLADMVEEGPVEGGAEGLIEGVLTRPLALGQQPDISQVPEAMIGGSIAAVPMAGGAMLLQNQPSYESGESDLPPAPEAPPPSFTATQPDTQSDEKIVAEPVRSIIDRTATGPERHEAIAKRREAAVRIAATLKKGDKVIEDGGEEFIIEGVLPNGKAFVEGYGEPVDIAALLVHQEVNDVDGNKVQINPATIVRKDEKAAQAQPEVPPPSFVTAAGMAANFGGTEAAKHVAAAQSIVDAVVPPAPEVPKRSSVLPGFPAEMTVTFDDSAPPSVNETRGAAPAGNDVPTRAAPAPVVSPSATGTTPKEAGGVTGDTRSLSEPLPNIPAEAAPPVNAESQAPRFNVPPPSNQGVPFPPPPSNPVRPVQPQAEPTLEDAKKVVTDLQNHQTGNGGLSLDVIGRGLDLHDEAEDAGATLATNSLLDSRVSDDNQLLLRKLVSSTDGRAMMRAALEQAREQQPISPATTAVENQTQTGGNTTDENAIRSQEGRQGQGRQEGLLNSPAATSAQTATENAPSAPESEKNTERYWTIDDLDVLSKEGPAKKRGTFPRFLVKVDDKTTAIKTPQALAKFLSSVRSHFPRVFKNTGKGVTIDFDISRKESDAAFDERATQAKPERRGGRKLPKIIKTLNGPTGDKTQPHILDYLYRNPIPLPPESVRKESGEWDWLGKGENKSINSFWYYKNLIFRDTPTPTPSDITNSIDELQEAGYFPGIANPTPEDLGNLIKSGIAEYEKARSEKGAPTEEEQRESSAEQQRIDFEKATESGPITLDPNALAKGDVLIIEGERATVTNVEFDEDGNTTSFTIRDGTKFGVQTVDGELAVHVDDYQPVERSAGEFAPEDLQATERSKASTKEGEQTDMFAGKADEPFNLISETKEEREAREKEEDRIAKKKADEERERARIEAEKAQMGFDLGGDEEFGRSTRTDAMAMDESADDAFERAMDGDESAFDEMDEAFRERFPQEPAPETTGAEELGAPQRVFTPAAFARLFDTAFAAKDFDSIIDAVKVSDKGVWVPLLKKFFAEQADSAEAAAKAEWMRHVFNGTRPPDAKAPATPPPPQPSYAPPPKPGSKTAASGGGTTAGTPPPPKPKPKPPKPAKPPRIPVAPITGGKAKSLYQIINDFSKAVGKFYHRRKMKPSQLGFYRPGSTLTAGRFAGDLDTVAHELAGHWTDDKYGLGRPWMAPRAKSPYDAELAKFWIHGSPERLLKRKRAEGIAEWIRAYIMNPSEAIKQAPTFAKYVEKTLPKEAMDALNQFSDDVRTWAGEKPIRRSALNVKIHPPTLIERLQNAILGDKREFNKTFVDRFRSWFDDSYHYAVKGWETALRMQGRSPETVKPSENFDLMLRFLSGHDARLSEQLETGLVPLRPKQVVRDGAVVVQQLTDPVTGEKMNLEWLLGAFDTSSRESMDNDMRETSGVMVAQRTLEKAAQIDRDAQAEIDAIDAKDPTKPRKTARILADAEHKKHNLSGLGGGLMPDVEAARQTMADLASDPARARRILEAARRYREWADKVLDYLVDSGLKSKEEVAQIRKENRQYVDMHRLTEEYDSASSRARGPWGMTAKDALGKVAKVIHRFRGSTLEIDNVYKNLLAQTDRIQKEAISNTVRQTFTKALQTSRKLYEGDPVELDRIGSEAKQEDADTVPVWENGKPTFWKFDPDIFETLKGLGDLGSHVFFDVLGLPVRLTRYLITHSPAFAARNPFKDTIHRAIVSETGNKPWDVLNGFSKEERTSLNIFGGGQFGNYAKDRPMWNRALKQGMSELRKDKRNIITTPLRLWRAWERLVESSEVVGRVSEMRSARRKAIDELHLSSEEAALYSAYEARSLMDYAKMGSWMRNINRLIPFSNAHIRGLTRTFREARKNPAAFAVRFSLYVVLPSLLVNALAHQGDYEEEYMQIPAWQRDFFWNIKLGPYWLRFAKPHELGVMASGVERLIDRLWYGKKNVFEGYAGSVKSALSPLNSVADLGGPAKTPIEMAFNYDTFRNSYIIPPRENELKLELRKGTKHASDLGKVLGKTLDAVGIGKFVDTDPRMMDHFLQSYGGFGQMATDFTNPNMRLGQALLKATGYTAMPPSTQSLAYQWVMDWAKQNGATGLPEIAYLRDLIEPVYKAASAQEADEAAKRLRERATILRQRIEAGEVTAPEMSDKSAMIPKDAYKTTAAMDKLADAGLFFGQPDAEGRKIKLPGGYSRDMTPEEAAKFHTTVGNAYRIYAEQQADALLAMPKDKAAAKLKKDLELIRELAAPKMR